MFSIEEVGAVSGLGMAPSFDPSPIRPGGMISPPPSTVQGFLAPGTSSWESATSGAIFTYGVGGGGRERREKIAESKSQLWSTHFKYQVAGINTAGMGLFSEPKTGESVVILFTNPTNQ